MAKKSKKFLLEQARLQNLNLLLLIEKYGEPFVLILIQSSFKQLQFAEKRNRPDVDNELPYPQPIAELRSKIKTDSLDATHAQIEQVDEQVTIYLKEVTAAGFKLRTYKEDFLINEEKETTCRISDRKVFSTNIPSLSNGRIIYFD